MLESAMQTRHELIENHPLQRMSQEEKFKAMQKKAMLRKNHYYQADKANLQEADDDEEGSDSTDTSTV